MSDPDGESGASTAKASNAAQWSMSIGLVAALVVGVLFAAVGLIASRIDVTLLSLPLLATAAWAWDRRARPSEHSAVSVTLAEQPDRSVLQYRIEFQLPPQTEAVQLRVKPLGLPLRQYVLSATSPGPLVGEIPLLHSGQLRVLRLEYRLLGADGAFLAAPTSPFDVETVVTPHVQAVASLPLPRQLQSVTGAHESSRPGDGGDFRDIHTFTPGDRLRRIDWKRTARRAQAPGELYVRRTAALADATVIIVVDSRDDVGENVVAWGQNSLDEQGLSSMDVAREAANSLAAAYIRGGDRVGFQDLGTRARMLAPSSGSRHLSRLLRVITLSRPSEQAVERRRPPLVPPGALIYLLSSFLDDDAAGMATFWRAGGHRVIGVDVLPAPRLHGLGREARVAHRIITMERDDRLEALTASGVELMRWQESGNGNSRAAALRALSRPARGAR